MSDKRPSTAAPAREPARLSLAQRMATAAAPALRSRDFRLFWIGQIVSTVGTSLQVVAEGWLVYNLTQSTFWLGMVGLLGLLPVVPISLLGGVLIDRVPRRRLILVTQSGLLIQAAVFGLLAVAGVLQLWHMIVLYFVFGALLAIDHPARRAFLVELVEQEALANAVALNATIYNLSSLIGYAVSGLLIASVGAGSTMLLNAATYLAPLLALSLIRTPDRRAELPPAEGPSRSLLAAAGDGIAVLRQRPAILGAIALMAVGGGLTWPVFGMMPAYAQEIMRVGAIGLGVLMACGALGSVLGTVLVGVLGAAQRGRTMTLAAFALPLLTAAFAMAPSLWLACLLLVAIGAMLLIVQSLAITLVQVNIPDQVRGRVMSVYSLLHAGSDTGGNVAVGWAATVVGLPTALALGAAAAGLFAVGLRRALPAVAELD